MPGRPEQRGRFPTGRERGQERLPRRRNGRRGKGQQEVESASSARAIIDFVFRPSAVINKRLVLWSCSMVLRFDRAQRCLHIWSDFMFSRNTLVPYDCSGRQRMLRPRERIQSVESIGSACFASPLPTTNVLFYGFFPWWFCGGSMLATCDTIG